MSTVRRARVIYSNPSHAARPKPQASGRERFWWYFMRLSGLALVILALGHMFIMHVLVELTGGEIDFAFVQSRWGTPFWRIYDLLLLVLAFIHGANGARIVIGDYIVHRTARGLLIGILIAISAIWLVLGMAVIVFFDPGTAPARRSVLVTLATIGRGPIPPTRVHELDAVVVGAGGAGLYAALELKKDLGPQARIGVISKLYPSRSHTGAAQGGVCAALGNTEEDHWEWHWFDTVKGGDYLVDQDAAEVMCHDAVETIINLEHLGLPFDRTDEGLINQRRFGGHTRNYGEGPVRRSCFAADRTGHAILQTLFQQCIKHEVAFFDEYQVLDLALPEGPDGPVSGVIALQLATSELHAFRAKAVLFATGGYGKIFKVTSNAHTLTGDGMAIPYRRGLPLEDMEFFQFHPTGMYKLGFLLSEAMRGEGGVLLNDSGERFMERYAPTMKDLASRDVVSRSIYLEIAEGRGIGGKDFVHLDVRHLGEEVLNKKLPDMSGFIRTYFGLEPLTDLVPIQPTAHYAMGGVPTDIDGRVLADETGRVVPGFYAAGEVACVSVHGANRLGTNSLLDILVFGRRAGKKMAAELADLPEPIADADAEASVQSRVSGLLAGGGRRAPGRDPLGAPGGDVREVRRLPHGPAPRRVSRCRGAAARARRAPSGGRPRVSLQHRPGRRDRAGLPARLRGGDRRVGAGAHGESWRARAGGLPRAGRHELAEAHVRLAWPGVRHHEHAHTSR